MGKKINTFDRNFAWDEKLASATFNIQTHTQAIKKDENPREGHNKEEIPLPATDWACHQ